MRSFRQCRTSGGERSQRFAELIAVGATGGSPRLVDTLLDGRRSLSLRGPGSRISNPYNELMTTPFESAQLNLQLPVVA